MCRGYSAVRIYVEPFISFLILHSHTYLITLLEPVFSDTKKRIVVKPMIHSDENTIFVSVDWNFNSIASITNCELLDISFSFFFGNSSHDRFSIMRL